jgi:hypothetical protein
MTPEARAPVQINWLLEATGGPVCDHKATNINAAEDIAIREFEFDDDSGRVDYLLKTCTKPVGAVVGLP